MFLALDGPVMDKHSTGGIGDLVSLLVAPMLAMIHARITADADLAACAALGAFQLAETAPYLPPLIYPALTQVDRQRSPT